MYQVHEPIYVDPANSFRQCWIEGCSIVGPHIVVVEGTSGPAKRTFHHVSEKDLESEAFRRKLAGILNS